MKKLLPCIVVAGMMTFLCCTVDAAGIFTRNYGEILPDSEITSDFENYKMDLDFNYYISGSDVYPNALMGLRKTVILDSDLWKKIEPSSETFRDLIQNMQKKSLSINQTQHGFAILNEKGEKIGIWYSILSARTSVQSLDGKVIVLTPDLNTYEKYER
jgi:hypothetical protein